VKPEEYEILYREEGRHWWYGGMQAITGALLNRWYRPGAGLRILDGGCGAGAAMTTYLAEYGVVTGFDLSMLALGFCRMRRAERLARASITHLPFAAQTFDLATSFEVLYERGVPNDFHAVGEFFRILARGGRLLLRLPAYDWLRGRHDEAVHTARRYTAARVAGLLQDNGFTVEHLSYANTFLFPIALIKRLTERILPAPHGGASDLTLNLGPLNGVLRAILAAEAPLVNHIRMPFGLSVIAVGRKP
jgi:SAM-dependent methyltransferase